MHYLAIVYVVGLVLSLYARERIYLVRSTFTNEPRFGLWISFLWPIPMLLFLALVGSIALRLAWFLLSKAIKRLNDFFT